MKRLFTFGCSFTQYHWPTWADILRHNFDYYENWGQIGGGNQFIFNSLNECIVKNKLSKNDTVIIMWTNITREDRYVHGSWLTPGNIYTNPGIYSDEFIEKFADEKGYLIRDMAFIHSAKNLLEYIGINYIFLSMVEISNSDQYTVNLITGCDDIFEAYTDTINAIRPSVHNVIFNFNWASRTFIPKFYSKEVHFNRIDLHPTPMEHLEYIDKILPEFTISDQIRCWVNEINNRLLDNLDYLDLWDEKKFRPNRW
jgi:hypothetical protein